MRTAWNRGFRIRHGQGGWRIDEKVTADSYITMGELYSTQAGAEAALEFFREKGVVPAASQLAAILRKRPGMLRNPIKGPGKFEGETYAAKYAYESPDEELGSVDELGWYGLFSGKIKGRGPFHIIVHEDSQGFVTGKIFDTEKELEKTWALIEADYAEFYGDAE